MIRLTRRSVLLGATALSAAGFLPGAVARAQANRTYHALLIAATAYPNLPAKATLVGPNHDAGLVKEYLLNQAPAKFLNENVTLLADGLEGASGSPTLETILAQFKATAAKVKPGDFVYIHYSGHGSQQPALVEGEETDGLDEIILPSDTGQWVDKTKGVPNALTDNLIGEGLDAIREKGAFVWIIFDCCNSGTATRAAPVGDEGVRERKLDPSELGIPNDAMTAAAAASASRSMTEDPTVRSAAFSVGDAPTGAESTERGDIVAFFAAQSIETTPEMPLPKGDPEATSFGLFTFTLFRKLAENPNITYRQLGHAVLQQYSADARVRPTPVFEGALDARVFGSETVDTPMQWQLEVKDGKVTLPAGKLHRLAPKTRLAIVPTPISEMSAALGYVEVTSAKNLTSTVIPVEFDGKPALRTADIPERAYARLVELAIDYKLVVARPDSSAGLEETVALVNRTLDELAAEPDKRFNVELVEPGAEADVRLAVLRENAVAGAARDATDAAALWFLPPSGDVALQNGAKPPLVAAVNPERLKTGTRDNLTKMFRATSLSRLAAGNDYKPEEVSVEFRIRRLKTDTMEPLREAVVPRVTPGDEVHIVAKNASKNKIVDINILYVGSDYSITHIAAQRLVAGATIEEGLLAFTDSSFGMERMIAVLTEAPPQSETEDLSFLQQGGVPPATRSAGSAVAGFSDMLRDIGMAPATRSVMKLGDKGAAKGGVLIFPVETVPLTN